MIKNKQMSVASAGVLEGLEQRLMMYHVWIPSSVSPNLVRYAEGTDGDDVIQVYLAKKPEGTDLLDLNGDGVEDDGKLIIRQLLSDGSEIFRVFETSAVEEVVIAGLAGNDRLEADSGPFANPDARVSVLLSIDGGGGADTIEGGQLADTIWGSGGADRIWAREGNDVVWGGGNTDRIQGGDGNDKLEGGRASDTLDGGAGNDTLMGRAGHDILYGNYGTDVLMGDGGDDIFVANEWFDELSGAWNLTSYDVGDRDTIYGGLGWDVAYIDRGLEGTISSVESTRVRTPPATLLYDPSDAA